MTEQELLKHINTECKRDYTSLSEVNWHFISWHSNLSENFIREFQDKIDWRSFFMREDMEQKLINLILK